MARSAGRLTFFLGASAIALAGCFVGPGATSPENPESCADGYACRSAAQDASDAVTAQRLYEKSCSFGEVHACVTLGGAYESGKLMIRYQDAAFPKDSAKAYDAYKRACTAKEHTGCLRLGELVARGEVPNDKDPAPYFERVCRAESYDGGDICGLAANAAKAQGDASRELELRTLGCDRGRHGCAAVGRAELLAGKTDAAIDHLHTACFYEKDADACFDQGAAAEKAGKAQDARYAYGDACDKGRKDACAKVEASRTAERAEREARERAEEARREAEWAAQEKEAAKSGHASSGDASSTSTGASNGRSSSASRGGGSSSVSMTDATANGVRASSLTCTLEDGGLMGSFVLLASLGDRKSALVACGLKPGQSFQAEWTMRHGAVTAAKVTGTGAPRTDACATEAMRKLKQAFTGRCSATMGIDR